jgi:hypothetical protein
MPSSWTQADLYLFAAQLADDLETALADIRTLNEKVDTLAADINELLDVELWKVPLKNNQTNTNK